MLLARALEDSLAAMRIALPEFTSTNVAATFPQSRNFRARLPRRQPVTTATASVAQRSISTKVTSRLRSLPRGSSMPSLLKPSIAKRTPRTCPAQRCPWACSASRRYSLRDFIKSCQLSAFSLTLCKLLSSPAHAVLRVFDEDAGSGEFCTQSVGNLEVAATACGLHLGDFLFDIGIRRLAGLHGIA